MDRDVLHLLAIDPDLPAVAQRLPVLLARSDHCRLPRLERFQIADIDGSGSKGEI
jgi:hypothetical protein